ncbi:transporter family-2 protein [Streptomyces olivoverticillatus]|uniref:Transporter family-2 protein n=1 Tax=Streptomyces olivoverticillatus TaxID=66427 RepID=A0A7W7PHZ7_9ACTN|nr:DMT family transporter [Streptomyces olivoverticillatus]MBB4891576.1 transporter family-2 protein [Streptomyces olivoverticillatus]
MSTEPLRGRARSPAIAAATAAGAVLALQAWINGRLGEALDDGVAAATVSDGLSFVLLAALCPFLPEFRRGTGRLARRTRGGTPALRPWHFLGGIVGGVVVLSQATSTAALGTALYTVALVAGQTLSGLCVDHRGIGPGAATPVDARRLTGAAVALAAVTVPLLGSLTAETIWLALLPFAAGIGLSWQMAVNGRLNAVAGSPYPSVALNFLLGVLVVSAAMGIDLALTGPPRHWPHDPLLYTGGLLGVAFVLASVLLVRHIGVLVMGLAMVGGQTVGSLVIDLAAGGGRPTGLTTLLSSAAIVVAAVLASRPGARPATTPSEPSELSDQHTPVPERQWT